jgi:hypothetical protein
MSSRKIEGRLPAGRTHDQGCRAKDRFRFEVPACEVTHQELRCAGPQTAAVDRDSGEGGKRVLCLFDVVEADHGKVFSDCDTRFGKRANEADRDDVVVTKGGGRGLGEVQQLRCRRPRT